ncbi:hypothetical protein SAMN05216337_10635 [Bradyrhizobium brasilense]|uniref:Uncharacterized protein n=1 Tax=Bradyrhizobium brasilense TaxID=1419277 RepID=A0A1G7MEW1_9BRAD|nr:hypothetical protein SAMN05216337_10635 [Bradyrhizobium brasilense]
MFASIVGAAVTQQKCQQLLSRPHEVHGGVHPSSGEITHCLMSLVWDLYRREVAGTMQNCQLLGVTAICLDPLPRLARDHGRCSNSAAMPQTSQLSVDAVAADASFVAELQSMAVLGQALAQLGQRCRRVWHRSDETDRSFASVFRHRYRNADFVSRAPRKEPSASALSDVEPPRPHARRRLDCDGDRWLRYADAKGHTDLDLNRENAGQPPQRCKQEPRVRESREAPAGGLA